MLSVQFILQENVKTSQNPGCMIGAVKINKKEERKSASFFPALVITVGGMVGLYWVTKNKGGIY